MSGATQRILAVGLLIGVCGHAALGGSARPGAAAPTGERSHERPVAMPRGASALAPWPGAQTPVSATTTPAAVATALAAPETDGVDYEEEDGGGGGGKNLVQVRNRTDGRLRMRGKIQVSRIPGPVVEPVNLAGAYSSCTDCQTIAVALQLNLISPSAAVVRPQNAAVALNVECLRCATIARALQYVLTVDDPTHIPDDAAALIREMERELRAIHADRDIGLAEAEARINAVIARFSALAESLDDQRAEDAGPAAAPAPTATPGPGTPPTPTVAPAGVSPTPVGEATATAVPATPVADTTATAVVATPATATPDAAPTPAEPASPTAAVPEPTPTAAPPAPEPTPTAAPPATATPAAPAEALSPSPAPTTAPTAAPA